MIAWKSEEVIFPMIPKSQAAGSIIRTAGLTAHIRGMKHKRADGSVIRPDLVLLDDPQTDESARSDAQSTARDEMIQGAVLGLAGTSRRISVLMPCTIIRKGDLADRYTDRAESPAWRGIRTKMMVAWPKNLKLWDQYRDILADGHRTDQGMKPATDFYLKHRKKMDEGAAVSWPERHLPDEASGIQHAMNLWIRNEAAFQSEYQNDPQEHHGDGARVSVDDIVGKLSETPRGQLPAGAEYTTAFVDVHLGLLYWVVTAWAPDFTGWVVDYGTFPEQGVRNFQMSQARKTLQKVFPGAAKEGAILQGLLTLLRDGPHPILRPWIRTDGSEMLLNRVLIDAGYALAVVQDAARRIGGVVLPSRGRGVTASGRPIGAYVRKKGALFGDNWYVPPAKETGRIRIVTYDTNFWKTFVHSRLSMTTGDPGSLSLYGARSTEHRNFAGHVADSEFWVQTEGRGRTLQEWRHKAHRPDNHWFDCLVGAAVAASTCGVKLVGDPQARGGKGNETTPKGQVAQAPTRKRRRTAVNF